MPSVAVTVNTKGPETKLTVPESVPLEAIVNPDGNPDAVHVSGAMLPVAVNVWVYGTPHVGFGRMCGSVRARLGTVIEKARVGVFGGESVGRTVKEKTPPGVGMPVIRPSAVSVSPGGITDPGVTGHVNPPVLP